MRLLSNKVSIVTGGSKGIGRAIALALAKEGAKVIVNYKNDKDSAKQIVAEINKVSEAIAIQADISKENLVKEMVDKSLNAFNHIDILINNAGIQGNKRNLLQYELNSWNHTLATNLTSAFLCCKHVLPYMISQRYGNIVNISSIAATDGYPCYTSYATSKAGLLGLTKSLSKETVEFNINVNAVIPGITKTDMASKLTEEQVQAILNKIPKGRMALPQEIAELVVFLCSEKARYITGESFKITGGR